MYVSVVLLLFVLCHLLTNLLSNLIIYEVSGRNGYYYKLCIKYLQNFLNDPYFFCINVKFDVKKKKTSTINNKMG